ncbi:MAG: alpha-L-rhamnosidase, partial [Marivirga sp.]|nr:alpha-L-rhamnosidase [Marivirga sp.]
MVKKIVCSFFLVLHWYLSVGQTGKLNPVDLTCEFIVNPLGIETHKPRFNWTFKSSERNQHQTAFEILVSDNSMSIQQSKGDIWSSGKIDSDEHAHITYNGVPLKSFSRYYWSVRTYDKNGQPGAWSGPAWFETAMLNTSDWKAKWIGDGSRQFERDEDFYKDDRMPLFRKELSLKKKISKARLYIAGVGYYEAYLNGRKISDHVLDPGWTPHKKEVLYVVHDITSALKQGTNVTAIMLGNGWWNPLPLRLFGRFNLRDFQQTGRPCVKAEIHIQYADGSSEILATDETWRTTPGPIIRNNVYLGEHYDARLELKNWNMVNTAKTPWKTAVQVQGPSGELHVQMQPPIRITKIVKPVKIAELKAGVYIVDMGQNFAGVAKIKVKGKAGTKISLRYGEALHPDGSLNYLTTVAGHIKEMWNLKGGPGAPATAWQEDSYTLKGVGTETWSPRFTFHGFRFIEITGWPGKPTKDDIEGLRMNSDLQKAGEFACSNEMFNKVHETTQWTFLSNVFSVQSDCPGREKMGYGADMVTTANTFIYNYDMRNFYIKAVRDFANEQQPDGGITEIAPYTGIHDKGLGGESGPLG